jgi:hypothetical protein
MIDEGDCGEIGGMKNLIVTELVRNFLADFVHRDPSAIPILS